MTGAGADPPGGGGDRPLRVVIVGGGVAGLEAALCLRELAGDRVAMTILAPQEAFVYLPMTVREPFGSATPSYPLAQIAQHAGAQLCSDSFAWLDREFSAVHTAHRRRLDFDAVLLTPGASVYASYESAVTLDPRRLDEQLRAVLEDVAGGRAKRLAFLIPDGPVWPLPIYELALMTAVRAREISAAVEITIVTPESAPLAVFGAPVAERIAQLLASCSITTRLSTRCAVREPGVIALHPGTGARTDRFSSARELRVDRVIALPQLFGPHCPGVPTTAHRGFISTDPQGRVRQLAHAFAAGDATDHPIKFGGISAHQADIAAQSIAALAGASVEPDFFAPELHAVLLTGGPSLMLDARLSGAGVTHSRVTEVTGPVPRAKIAARYLAPYLEAQDVARAAHTFR